MNRRVTLLPIGIYPKADAMSAGCSGVIVGKCLNGEPEIRLDNGNVVSWPADRLEYEDTGNVVHVDFRRVA
ncbi:hypothetical protein [Acetobacter oeni]|uniref:Uncharacterized protein n=1 Tax=Acetobacter oeni TaxID=304077 RepID=A0A511XJS9_9PROT|nr:hypothetical protein [Acetobacter oeni]MBB3883397.1 hypothetical protein [Acetobacter oeni]NHO19373.1 hypothetical protein [Acetobacter oeni]GBR03939.1 hypothetical protein AA21952_1233 [Acetobacter oeni LMG 21952]GEN63178.1 hypothetical protein AOE01nite_14020 [Acetobacter oeni]